jgi:competence protein ComFC
VKPERISGKWRAGWTLDLHTLTSVQRPDGSFDTTRSELGEMLYQLKYRHNRSHVRPIAELTAGFLKKLLVFPYLKGIVPIPPSDLSRTFQPVHLIATEVGKIVDLPAPLDYLIKIRETTPLKNLEDQTSRREQIEGAMQVADDRFRGQYVLLFDDLYRSGETLNAATTALKDLGGAARVYVLALTRTRTRR